MTESNTLDLWVEFTQKKFDVEGFFQKAQHTFLPFSTCVVQGGTRTTAHIRFEKIQADKLSPEGWDADLSALISEGYEFTAEYVGENANQKRQLKYSKGELASDELSETKSLDNTLFGSAA